MRAYIAIIGVVFSFGCESVVVSDPFAVADGDSLHSYASNGKVPLDVRGNSPLFSVESAGASAEGAVSIDPDNPPTADGDVLKVTLLTGDAGTGTVNILDAGGGVVATREITVVDVEEIALAVTAPATVGIELPEIGDRVRVAAGGTAAFRTTLTANGAEVFGTDMIDVALSDESVTARSGIGCAPDTCDALRAATEFSVPAATAGQIAVTLTTGNATRSFTIVATPVDEITDVVLDHADLLRTDQAGLDGSIVAQVFAGDERVLGAPVTWSIDGTPIADAVGDALQFTTSTSDSSDVVASVGDQQASALVAGTDFRVTSITAACGASGTAPMLIALFALARRVAASRGMSHRTE